MTSLGPPVYFSEEEEATIKQPAAKIISIIPAITAILTANTPSLIVSVSESALKPLKKVVDTSANPKIKLKIPVLVVFLFMMLLYQI